MNTLLTEGDSRRQAANATAYDNEFFASAAHAENS
jgi:hypothetical protein